MSVAVLQALLILNVIHVYNGFIKIVLICINIAAIMQLKITVIGYALIVLNCFHFMLYLMKNFQVLFQV